MHRGVAADEAGGAGAEVVRTSEEILMNVTPRETRVAVVENGVLQELYIERTRKRGLVGNVYKGRVVRVLPGMEAAFVDIGLERAAFLHVSDIQASVVVDGEAGPGERGAVVITDLVREGQELLVQVVKDPLGTKGARLTTHVTIPSRYLVYLPGTEAVGVSVKIDDDTERARLKEIIGAARAEFGGGYIVRTAGEGVEAPALRADMAFLQKLWASIQERARETRPGTVIHEDLPLVLRVLRDFVGGNVEKVRVDSRETHERLLTFAERFVPEMRPRIEHYPGERPIFDLYGIEDELQRALDKKVQLKSGGYLIIDQTEAMTTIDVNTGGYVGHRNLEETIFKTNLEAAGAIARQLRLRNLGGIIIIDFIDMSSEEHKQAVFKTLERALERDHAKNHICEVSALGLVEMTRKRTRESLEHVLCEPCPLCSGRGTIKTAETVCYEIFREIIREARQYEEARQFLVLAATEVVDLMLDEESTSVAELEAFIGTPIRFQAEAQYTREQYDVVLM
ncbi:RNAse G [Plasticicumulans lactativorans]|uniref:Ribonuclease G n=1 Tax=Plasticicumulans lactativorans TaxID=1133106 RepID=A0A4R2LEI8_9GAMM|nr:ribonuclease G [Plasticicumulans lactativorans]TCO83003.1 RNAse G [Plasticicumulans lactativorans]